MLSLVPLSALLACYLSALFFCPLAYRSLLALVVTPVPLPLVWHIYIAQRTSQTGGLEPFSNRRHALIQVCGEKVVLAHYVDLAETALACLTAVDTAELVSRYDLTHPLRSACLVSRRSSPPKPSLSLPGLCCCVFWVAEVSKALGRWNGFGGSDITAALRISRASAICFEQHKLSFVVHDM